jgi:predicted PurR-regulated permease PerM
MEGSNVRKYLFLGFFLILLILVARLFAPFVTIIIWSGLLYAFLAPAYEALARSKSPKPLGGVSRTLLAAIMAILSVALVLVPIFLLGMSMLGQVKELAHVIKTTLDAHPELLDLSTNGPVGKLISDLSQGSIDLSRIDVRGEITAAIDGSASQILSLSGILVGKVAMVLISVAFIVFTLFFLFLDGPELLQILLHAIPIEREYSLLFLRTLRKTSRDLVAGYVLVALVQGSLAFGLFTIFGIKGALVLGVLTMAASFIPMLGTGLVWGPVSGILIFSGDIQRGILLLLLSAVIVAGLDNFLKVFVLRDRLKSHPLLIFFAIVGGLELFGFNGIILGPLILITFFTGAKLYDKVTQRDDGDHGRSDVENQGS